MSRLLTLIPQDFSPATLMEALEVVRVEVFVDVRMTPATPGHVGLDAFSLRPALMARGMRYIYMGDCLGSSSWREEERFQGALKRVSQCAACYKTALFGAPREASGSPLWETLAREFKAWDVELRGIAHELEWRVQRDEA
ncbi:MAG: hypothetical protein AAGI01_17275 [Myxococcota bacterium]